MRTIAIIQARMGSSRLPGKVLLDIAGRPMLAHVAARTQLASCLSDVLIATTTATDDDAIVELARSLEVPIYRGSEADVLGRYLGAARQYEAETIVRITADCPLIDPVVIDTVVGAFSTARPDYASNTLQRTYPRGLDVEVFGLEPLITAEFGAVEQYQRSHVTPYFYQNPDLFNLLNVAQEGDDSHLRWTVDTHEDLQLVREIHERMGDEYFTWRQAIELFSADPGLELINRRVLQKDLGEG